MDKSMEEKDLVIKELTEQNFRLKSKLDALRDATLNIFCFLPEGSFKLALHEAYNRSKVD